MNSSPIMMVASGLVKSFPDRCKSSFKFWHSHKRITVLKSIDLKIYSGEIIALLGPNGAGKTTLFRLLSGLLMAEQGEISFYDRGRRISTPQHHLRVGLLPDTERSFYWRLTGRQNLDFFASLTQMDSHEIKPKIEEAIQRFGLSYIDRRYLEFSAGMKQRLCLARSFIQEHDLLLLDEPTKSLDPESAAALRSLILKDQKENPERTIFFSTHLPYEAQSLASRIIILTSGKITAQGSFSELQRLFGTTESSLEDIYLNVQRNWR